MHNIDLQKESQRQKQLHFASPSPLFSLTWPTKEYFGDFFFCFGNCGVRKNGVLEPSFFLHVLFFLFTSCQAANQRPAHHMGQMLPSGSRTAYFLSSSGSADRTTESGSAVRYFFLNCKTRFSMNFTKFPHGNCAFNFLTQPSNFRVKSSNYRKRVP